MAVAARRGESSPFALWFSRNLTGWIFLIPTLFFFCGWALYPIIKVLYISFTNLQFICGVLKSASLHPNLRLAASKDY